MFTEELTHEMAAMQFAAPVSEQFSRIPFVRFTNALHHKLFSGDPEPRARPEPGLEKRIEYTLTCLIGTRKYLQLLRLSTVPILMFFLQPNVELPLFDGALSQTVARHVH